uniref:F-box domain-containing protein n=2 Tax=Quercus lobata TaxID=97700 RepID=A0A7N2R6E2_QUELO
MNTPPHKHNRMNESPISQPKFPSESLPDHIIHEILTWLPVKSLIRFRCVSKSWYSTITSRIFINMHLDRAISLFNYNSSNHNGYLLYSLVPMGPPNCRKLFTGVRNSDGKLTQISSIEIPFCHSRIAGFCNGMFCFASYLSNCKDLIYLWNPSIRKFKMLDGTSISDTRIALGLAYHSENNDFKILRIGEKLEPAEAEVYTLSTDSWRRVVISVEGRNGSIDGIDDSPCVFFNGALHCIAYNAHKFILSFDVNEEKFGEIMLPQNYLDELDGYLDGFSQNLTVFKGSLALIVFGKARVRNSNKCHIWVMKEYGVVKSWTQKSLAVGWVDSFYGCTDDGELLIEKRNGLLLSFDPESLKKNSLGFQFPTWVGFTSNFMESLVLLE